MKKILPSHVFVALIFVGFLVYNGLYYIFVSHRKNKDVVVVLGGGLLSDGQVPKHTELRLQAAAKLYEDILRETNISPLIITLSGGTPHKPNPIDSNGFTIFEATAAARWLYTNARKYSIDIKDIMEENFSLDTIGNAYFLRTTHVEVGNYQTLHIITNDWHMERSKSIFDYIFGLPPTSSSHVFWWQSNPRRFKLNYVAVQSGIDGAEVLRERTAREKQSLTNFDVNVKSKFSSMEGLHKWLFIEHDAYSTKRFKKVSSPLNPELLKSY